MSVQALLTFFLHLEFPEMALALILTRTLLMTVRVCWKQERMPARFFISACLGIHASSKSSQKRSTPLASLDPTQVERIPHKIGILWFGRVGLLLAFLAQYIGSTAIWIRMVFHIQDRGFWHWNIDMRTFEVALGGLIATVNSTLILLAGNEWKNLESFRRKPESHNMERMDTSSTSSTEKDGLELHPSNREAEHSNKQRQYKYLASVNSLNSSFEQCLDRFFPRSVQFDLQLAVLLYRALTYSITVYTFHHRFSGGCPPILQFLSEASPTFDWTQVCPDRTDIWDPTTFSLYPRQREHTRHGNALQISCILSNIGMCWVLAHWISKIIVKSCEMVGRPLPKSVRSLERWVLSGRTLVSFPFLLLLFSCSPFWTISMLEQRGWIKQAQAVLQSREIGETDRLAMGVLMWKDPLLDNLYLL